MRFSKFSAALDAVPIHTSVFFRDDDAGWADERLLALMDVFEQACAPIDLAVIPQALTNSLALELCARRVRGCDRIGLHQHGYAHTNHETEGRKCEFGVQRFAAEQLHDVAEGQFKLRTLLGGIDPIFTPPWNRCTQATVQALRANGLQVLSRDATAAPLELGTLRACPVHVDWCKWTNAQTPDWAMLDQQFARTLDTVAGPHVALGVMLHHAVMTDSDWQALRELLALLNAHARVRLRLMRELIHETRQRQAAAAHI